jgi:hypothetical protein
MGIGVAGVVEIVMVAIVMVAIVMVAIVMVAILLVNLEVYGSEGALALGLR